jgi:hypothetical protein
VGRKGGKLKNENKRKSDLGEYKVNITSRIENINAFKS